MPLDTAMVGFSTPVFRHEVDARWLMAYAAGIADHATCYFDTTRPLAMHPVFPVCPEWDAILAVLTATLDFGLDREECARSVHAEHDLQIFKPVTPGTVLSTQASVIGVEARKPGAFLTMRIDATDAAGDLVYRTWQGNLFRGVEASGLSRPADVVPALPSGTGVVTDAQVQSVDVPPEAAHTYTECSRIWNPIHTDKAVALAAGLPAIILHGTATLAYVISALIERWLPDQPERLSRLGGRFSGMVLLPDQLRVESQLVGDGVLSFRVRNADGLEVIRNGHVSFVP